MDIMAVKNEVYKSMCVPESMLRREKMSISRETVGSYTLVREMWCDGADYIKDKNGVAFNGKQGLFRELVRLEKLNTELKAHNQLLSEAIKLESGWVSSLLKVKLAPKDALVEHDKRVREHAFYNIKDAIGGDENLSYMELLRRVTLALNLGEKNERVDR